MAIEDEVQRVTPEQPSPTSKKAQSPTSQEDFILSVASNIASQPLHNFDQDVWGVLTAISANARKRRQGIHVLLTAEEHCMGRIVDDKCFQIESMAVSSKHCIINKKKVAKDDERIYATLKDTSTNGTYLNSVKLNKRKPEARLCHGDIISFASAPHHENAFAFVYREVHNSTPLSDGAAKRKAEDLGSESKRHRGIGIGSSEGPISLDDFRSLQRSNTDLRKQLEDQVLTAETLRNENRETIERHENEMKDLKEAVTKSYTDQVNNLHHLLEDKHKELLEVNKISAEQKYAAEGLNERLNTSIQSCSEANDILNSQKTSISELKSQLDEERDQRREEREKAARDLKAAIQKAQIDAQDELKRLSESASSREREQEEVINKLQESEKESCLLVETLRSKLEGTRQKLVLSDNKVRELESQVCKEQLASTTGRKRIEELEQQIVNSRKELESEKKAREEAWAKVSLLELEINAALRDLDYERRRLRGAKERIMLRETQLRAFYSTTEEISSLFTKQQDQLKAMQRTLEDEENYENMSVDGDLNVSNENLGRKKESLFCQTRSIDKAGSSSSTQKVKRKRDEPSSEENSATEKHECDIRSQEEKDENTQEVEFKGVDSCVKGAFGSDICGGTEPIETERVLDTESPNIDGDRNIDLNKCGTLAGDTMQLDDETQLQEKEENQAEKNDENIKAFEDTEGGTIRTSDLITSEVAASWANSTAPSFHGENDSERSRAIGEEECALAIMHDSNSLVAESQSTPNKIVDTKQNDERQALSEMIGIVAPELKDQFGGENGESSSAGSDTVDATDDENEDDGDNGVCDKSRLILDSETEGDEDENPNEDAMDEDSLG